MDKSEEWKTMFNNILSLYSECNNNLNLILNQYNNIKKNISHQKNDDILFYNSILKDTIFYYKNSIIVRKKKFIYDIHEIEKFFDKKKIVIKNDITLEDFELILNSYTEVSSKSNTTELKWIKDDFIVSLLEWEKDLKYTLHYHTYYISHLNKMIKNDATFYTDIGKINQEEE